jgi:HEAT repeat protein
MAQRRWIVGSVALVLANAGAGRAETDLERLRGLVRDGNFRAAYEQQLHGGQADVAGLALSARALLGVAMESDDGALRWAALRAALPLHQRELAQSARASARSADRYEQSLALEILGNSDPHGRRADLLAALESPFRPVRVRALRGLATLKDPELADRFGVLLASDPDPDLRALAARALADTGAAHAALMLYQALDDPAGVVQEQAVLTLVRLKDHEVVAVVQRRLAHDPPEKRVQNIRLAGLIPDVALVADLGPFLADRDPEVRAFAAAAVLSILEHTAPAAER